MTDYTPSKEAVERAARAFFINRGLDPDFIIFGGLIEDYTKAIRAALIAGHEPAPVPQGWKLVPVEPTEAMIEAGWIDKEDVDPDDIYRAMLAAASLPPTPISRDEP